MTGAGGFTGAAGIPARETGMLIPALGVNIRPKKKKLNVRKQAEALVDQLIGHKNSR